MLLAADKEADLIDTHYSSKEVLKALREAIGDCKAYIVQYISYVFDNSSEAELLALAMVEAADKMHVFPKTNASYIRP